MPAAPCSARSGCISGRLELGTSFGSMKPEEQHDLTRLYPVLRGTQSFRPVDMLVEGREDPVGLCLPGQPRLVPGHPLQQPRPASTPSPSPISGDQADTGSLGHDRDADLLPLRFLERPSSLANIAGSESITRPLKPHQALTYSLHRKAGSPAVPLHQPPHHAGPPRPRRGEVGSRTR